MTWRSRCARVAGAISFVCALFAVAIGDGAESGALAADETANIVRSISVEGTQRIEPLTVKSYLAIQEGQVFNEQLIDLSLKTLFATGLFADVQIREAGGNVTVAVVENPIINRVAFEGNQKLTTEDLEAEVQLKPRIVFTRAKAQADVQRIIELYRRSGRFAATVEPKIVELPQNRVDLVFEISEGPVTGVNRINFIGNKVFSDSELRSEIATKESAWWRFLTSSDNYDPDRLTFDREQLRRFYLTNGYADFRVVSAVAELAPDGSGFFITFTVEEGEQYSFGAVSVDTSLAELPASDLEPLLLTVPGDVYNAELIDKSVDALTFIAGTKGYAFAEIKPRVRRNREEKLIDIIYTVEEGPRVYVDRINIVGNSRTLDRVIRREFRLAEGDAFNRVLIDRSRARIRGLGFFKKVEVTEEPGSAPDRTVLNVEVEEQSTGELSLGFGVSSADAFILDVSVTERNLLGRGQFLRLRLSASGERQQIDLRFTEPYFLDRNLAVGFDLYKILSQYDASSYEADATGFGLRAGFPLSEFARFNTRYTIRQDDIDPDANASPVIQQLDGSTLSSLVGFTVSYADTDDPYRPTRGFEASFTQDLAGLGGDIEFYRSQIDATVYQRLFIDELVGSLGISAGYIDSYGGDDFVRVNDRFFKGGSTFRGFENAGVGPRDTLGAEQDAVGGQLFAVGTAEIRFPNFLPEELGVATSLFTDFGTVGIVDDATKDFCTGLGTCFIEDDLALRASAGLSLLWDSPFGPVRLDFAHAFAREDYDKTEAFRFSAGTRF
ncbi:MAG: outer membrane protein assembly factor BamA [Alphaproteobacteria bacterium]|nr:outer membrane protein assembly factor BamA [Alphaproteobacteria bacterium]